MPDYLVTAPALQAEAIQYGNIFTAACNIHDQCYGTFGAQKDRCDNNLAEDMNRAGQQSIPYTPYIALGPYVALQAQVYAYGLQNYFVSNNFSNEAFSKAQSEASCRNHRELVKEYCSDWFILDPQ